MATVESPVSKLSVQELAFSVQNGWANFLVSESKKRRGGSSRRANVYASAYRECERRMTLEMVAPDALPPFLPDTLANFRRGEDRERNLRSDLIQIGRDSEPAFEFIGEQERFELKDRKGRVAITGKVDGFIKFADGVKAPTEIKSWNPNTVARIRTFEDLMLSPWTKAGAHQILAYLFGSNQPFGFLLLDRPGIPALITVEMTDANLERMETFLTRAESAMAHADAITGKLEDGYGEFLPPFIDDPSECKRCPFFGTVCQPPIKSEGAQMIVDEEVLADLDRWHELKAAGEEFEDLDTAIKKRFYGVELAIGGQYLLQGKWKRGVKLELPDAAKEQIAAIQKPYKKPVEKGSFSLSIVRTDAKD